MLYHLFWEKNILPGTYYNLPLGEKCVLQAFWEKQMEARDYKRRRAGL